VSRWVSRLKVAVTDFASLIVTSQAPVPLQAPDEPAKTEPEAAFWVSVTLVPWLNGAEQVPGHLIPAGELSTSPLPVPLTVTLSRWVSRLKVAVTDFASLIVTSQAPV